MTRALTAEQKAALTASLPPDGSVQILLNSAIEDAVALANDFSGVFTDAGWTVVIETPEGIWPTLPTGLALMAPGDLPLTDAQSAFMNAMTAADVPFNRLDSMLPEPFALKLMIGREGV